MSPGGERCVGGDLGVMKKSTIKITHQGVTVIGNPLDRFPKALINNSLNGIIDNALNRDVIRIRIVDRIRIVNDVMLNIVVGTPLDASLNNVLGASPGIFLDFLVGGLLNDVLIGGGGPDICWIGYKELEGNRRATGPVA